MKHSKQLTPLVMIIIVIVASLSFAGGPKYLGQVEVFMLQAGHSQPVIDSVLALPAAPMGKFLFVSEDYLYAAIVTVKKDATFFVKILYDRREKK